MIFELGSGMPVFAATVASPGSGFASPNAVFRPTPTFASPESGFASPTSHKSPSPAPEETSAQQAQRVTYDVFPNNPNFHNVTCPIYIAVVFTALTWCFRS